MGDIKHRIGLGTVGNAIAGKNDITAGSTIIKKPDFTFDATDVFFDGTTRKFDEEII